MKKLKDLTATALIYLSSTITIGILIIIIGFIFVKGFNAVDLNFLKNDFNDKTYYLYFQPTEIQSDITSSQIDEKATAAVGRDYQPESVYVDSIGGGISSLNKEGSADTQYIVSHVEKGSAMEKARDRSGNIVGIEEGYEIKKINGEDVEGKSLQEIKKIVGDNGEKTIEFKVVSPGGGVFPNIVTTVYMIFLSLSIAAPIGVLAAVYLTEYAKPGRLVSVIRFATESLSGIPSIIFGLFGMAFFVVFLKFNLSIISGALTVSIILLPTIIRSTEEAIKAVPNSYREASYGLGASKLQTITRIVLPSAMPGILVAVILSIGRIIGESAALLLTAGTVAKIPDSVFSSGSTLTVQAYYLAKEEANIEMACAIGVVVVFIVLILNLMAKAISRLLNRNN